MKKIEITNSEILRLLNKKSELANKNPEIIEAMSKLENEYNKNISQIKRLDEKVRPKIAKIIPKMEEYEQVSRVHLEKGKWHLEIVNRLEEFKQSFKQ